MTLARARLRGGETKMAKLKQPQSRSWEINDLEELGRQGQLFLKAIPVLILEKWVREDREEGTANYIKTEFLAKQLIDRGFVTRFKPKGTSALGSVLVRMQNLRNLTNPPLIELRVRGTYWVNLPRYEQLLQEYRRRYRDYYPALYRQLFPEGEPEWEPPTVPEAQTEREETTAVDVESVAEDKVRSLLAPLELALRDGQQAIDRLTEENRKLKAELGILQTQDRDGADTGLMFVHTSPDFHHSVYGRKVTSIKDTIEAMLQKAQHSIRVSTLQIDIFADDLIALKRRDSKLEITVLTRAKAQGDRKGIATRAIPRMKSAGIKVHTDQELLHSRMLVIDDQEVLVSSADLDVTQTELEFNAGIWTNSPNVVREAISYFDNILNVRRQP
jgi:hypothetical protein